MRGQSDKDTNKLFIQLYDTHKGPLRGYLRSMGIIEESLDDIIQEAFLRLYDRMGQPDHPIERANLERYLYIIARNIAYDRHRHDKRISHLKAEFDDSLLQTVPDKTPSPEEIYEEKELLEMLKKAVEKLPEKLAEAVKGLLEGKTFEVVARDAGIQVPALKYRLRKAKELLQDG